MTGHITRLNLKPKVGRARGLPKLAVPELMVTAVGVQGDFNRWRTESAQGDPDQAVLLLSEERLAELRAEGWPVAAGDLGENLTVAGLPEAGLRPGVELRAGKVRLVISKACEPCIASFALCAADGAGSRGCCRAGRCGWACPWRSRAPTLDLSRPMAGYRLRFA